MIKREDLKKLYELGFEIKKIRRDKEVLEIENMLKTETNECSSLMTSYEVDGNVREVFSMYNYQDKKDDLFLYDNEDEKLYRIFLK